MTDSLRIAASWYNVPVGRLSGELDSALHLRVRTEAGNTCTIKEVGDDRRTIEKYLGWQNTQYWRMMYFAVHHNGS